MRFPLLAAGLLAACQPTELVETGPDYSVMSCTQLLKIRTAMEREASFFASTQGMVVADPAGAMMRSMNNAAIAQANMAHANRMNQAASLRAGYREVSAAIIENGC